MISACPHCGAPLSVGRAVWDRESGSLQTPLGAMELIGRQSRLFDILWRSRGVRLKSQVIFDRLVIDDPNGGPESGRMIIGPMVRQLNEKLRPLGLFIEASNRLPQGYRLVELQRAKGAA